MIKLNIFTGTIMHLVPISQAVMVHCKDEDNEYTLQSFNDNHRIVKTTCVIDEIGRYF